MLPASICRDRNLSITDHFHHIIRQSLSFIGFRFRMHANERNTANTIAYKEKPDLLIFAIWFCRAKLGYLPLVQSHWTCPLRARIAPLESQGLCTLQFDNSRVSTYTTHEKALGTDKYTQLPVCFEKDYLEVFGCWGVIQHSNCHQAREN